jgi:hypothetical protein
MSLLPLPSQTLAWLKHAADAGQCEPLVLLHLIARADKRDQDVGVFVNSYSKTIAALCRRLEALERGAGLRHPVEDDATESDSVSDTAQRITDTATQIRREAVELATASALDHAVLIAFALGREPWSTWLRKGGCLESAHCELSDLMLAVLARWGHSTPPAPVPGEVAELVAYLRRHSSHPEARRAATLLQQQCAPPAPEPGPTFQDAIKLAEGCHDYSGGHSGAEGEAWHGALDTVVGVLKKAADGPWDSQTMAVFGVGVEAGAGELEVSERLRIVKAGIRARLRALRQGIDLPPAPQAGEVEA